MKNRTNNKVYADLLRYRKGEMTGSERNAFEKELERDPFLAEALEGLESVSDREAARDLQVIGTRISRRAGRKRSFVVYRIAASVAVLMIISSVFIVVERNKPEKQEAMPAYREVTMDIARSEPVKGPGEPAPSENAAPPPPVKKSSPQQAPAKQEEKQVVYDMVREEKEVQGYTAEQRKIMADYRQEPKISDSNRFLSERAAAVQPSAAVRSHSGSEVPERYSPPQPEGGQESFDKYVKENIRRPDTTTTGQRVVVVTAFRVKTDGRTDSIRIVRSPGRQFSDEAMRLIKEGPAWKPATRNGVAVEDEVTLSIVFP